jgi:hypothetical protein
MLEDVTGTGLRLITLERTDLLAGVVAVAGMGATTEASNRTFDAKNEADVTQSQKR